MTIKPFVGAATLALILSSVAAPSLAGPGHDHGNEAASAPAGTALPRFSATSETFELVGVVSGQHLTIYLDRYADNSPVKNAKVALEIAGAKLTAVPSGDGEFEAELPKPLPHGVTPVTAMISVGSETDLLAGQVEMADTPQTTSTHAHWQDLVGRTAAGVAALLLVVFVVRRLLKARRLSIQGAA